jgi:hypothetical protein
MSLLGEAYLTLRATTDQMANDLNAAKELAVTGAQGISEAFAGLVSGVGLAIGADLFKNWISQAAEVELSIARFDRVFQNMGSTVGYTKEQMAGITAEVRGMSTASANETRQAMQNMMAFTNVRGDLFRDAMKSAADLATMMGTNLPQAARTLGHALENPEHAMRLLRQAGISLTKVQEYQLQNAGDLAARQAALMNIIQSKSGGMSLIERESFSGQMKLVENDMKEATRAIGDALKDAVKPVLPLFSELANVVKSNKTFFAEMGSELARFAGAATSGITAVIRAISNISPETKRMVGHILEGAVALIGLEAGWKAIAPIVYAISIVITSALAPINLATIALIALGKAFYDALGGEAVKGLGLMIWDKLSSGINTVYQAVLRFGNALSGSVRPALDVIVSVGVVAWQKMSGAISTAWQLVIHFATEAAQGVQRLVSGFGSMSGSAQRFLGTILDIGIATASMLEGWRFLSPLLGIVVSMVMRMLSPINLVMLAVTLLGKAFYDAMGNKDFASGVIGVWESIKSGAMLAYQAVVAFGRGVYQAVAPAFENLYHTVSTAFTKILQAVGNMSTGGLTQWAAQAGAVIGAGLSRGLDMVSAGISWLGNHAPAIFKAVADAVQAAYHFVMSLGTALYKAIAPEIVSLVEQVARAFGGLGDDIASGVTAASSWGHTMGTVVGKAVATVIYLVTGLISTVNDLANWFGMSGIALVAYGAAVYMVGGRLLMLAGWIRNTVITALNLLGGAWHIVTGTVNLFGDAIVGLRTGFVALYGWVSTATGATYALRVALIALGTATVIGVIIGLVYVIGRLAGAFGGVSDKIKDLRDHLTRLEADLARLKGGGPAGEEDLKNILTPAENEEYAFKSGAQAKAAYLRGLLSKTQGTAEAIMGGHTYDQVQAKIDNVLSQFQNYDTALKAGQITANANYADFQQARVMAIRNAYRELGLTVEQADAAVAAIQKHSGEGKWADITGTLSDEALAKARANLLAPFADAQKRVLTLKSALEQLHQTLEKKPTAGQQDGPLAENWAETAKKQLEDFKKAWDAMQKDREKNEKDMQKKDQDMTPHAPPVQQYIQVKFEQGESIWKKIQESVSGMQMLDQAKRQTDLQNQTAQNTGKLVDLHQQQVNKPMPAPTHGPATVAPG